MGAALLALLASASRAGDTYASLKLPDLGHGSRAHADALGGDMGDLRTVCGDVTLPDGRRAPAVWELDIGTGDAGLELLPLPAGAEGATRGILVDNDIVASITALVAGTVTSAGGSEQASIWIGDSGSWTQIELPDAGFGARAHCLAIAEDGAALIGGDYVTSGGRTRPVVWSYPLAGGGGPVGGVLPDLPGVADGSIRGILVDNDIVASFSGSQAILVGEASTQGIGPLPLAWFQDMDTGSSVYGVLPLPPGVTGVARAAAFDPISSSILVGGTASTDDTDVGMVWKWTGVWAWAALATDGLASASTSVAVDGNGLGRLVGVHTTPGGLDEPVEWIVDLGTGTSQRRPLPVASGSGGCANQIMIDFTSAGFTVGTTKPPLGPDEATAWVELLD